MPDTAHDHTVLAYSTIILTSYFGYTSIRPFEGPIRLLPFGVFGHCICTGANLVSLSRRPGDCRRRRSSHRLWTHWTSVENDQRLVSSYLYPFFNGSCAARHDGELAVAIVVLYHRAVSGLELFIMI